MQEVQDLADTIRKAFKLAKSGRPGPVLVDIPRDVQIAKYEYELGSKVEADELFPAKDIRIEEAAKIINSAKKPYIYFGGGLTTSNAQVEMLSLADKIDSPIGSSLMGLSSIPGNHPRFLGLQGMHGRFTSSMAMHNADVIIALGVRFNDRVTGNREKFAKNAKIVHIDVDGSELSKTVTAICGLRGDVKLTLEKLLPLLNEDKKPEWAKEIEAFRKEEETYLDNREELTPRKAILTLNKYLGENTAVCTDVGQHQMWSAQNLNFKTPRRFISSGGLGTMGFGLGAAIGAALGTKEKSVLVTGDASFSMNLTELSTAVRYNIPIVIFIMNNGVLGMVRQWQTLFFDKHYSNTVLGNTTDFVALAKSFGVGGEAVTTIEELDKAFSNAFKINGPYIIECKIDKDEFVLPMLPPGGSMDDIILKLGVYSNE